MRSEIQNYKCAGHFLQSPLPQTSKNRPAEPIDREDIHEALSVLEATVESRGLADMVLELRRAFEFDLALLDADGPSRNLEFSKEVLQKGDIDG